MYNSYKEIFCGRSEDSDRAHTSPDSKDFPPEISSGTSHLTAIYFQIIRNSDTVAPVQRMN